MMDKQEYRLTPLEVGEAWRRCKGPFVTQDAVDMQFDKVWPLVEQLQQDLAWSKNVAENRLSIIYELEAQQDRPRAIIEELKALLEELRDKESFLNGVPIRSITRFHEAIRKASDLLDTNSASC